MMETTRSPTLSVFIKRYRALILVCRKSIIRILKCRELQVKMIEVLLDSIRLIYLWRIPILTVVLSLVAIVLTYLYQKRIHDAEKLFSAFPSLPSRLPIIGNLHYLSGNLTGNLLVLRKVVVNSS